MRFDGHMLHLWHSVGGFVDIIALAKAQVHIAFSNLGVIRNVSMGNREEDIVNVRVLVQLLMHEGGIFG